MKYVSRWIGLGVLGLVLTICGCGPETKPVAKGSGDSKAKTSGDMKKTSSTGGGGKACVMSTINGDSNVPFYKEFANQGLTADDCPIMACSVAEDELRAMDVPPLVGHLACWNYYQSIETPENKKFVKDFKDYCVKKNLPGGADRVTDDPIEAAYFGVYVWKAAAEKAKSFDVDKVRAAVYGLEFDAPGGKKKMDPKNQHTWKPVFIGEIKKDGQFKIINSSAGLVAPDSYSKYLHTDGKIPAPTGGPKEGKTPESSTDGKTVKIGILHSLTGTMAISEISLRDAVLMAVDEINAAGGVLGKQIEPVVVDPASDWPLFNQKAKELITTHKVAVTFGCWTSVSRKSVLPAFEEYNQLLFYPVQYEGEEQSLNVFYTGAAPNQQLIPAAEYMMEQGYTKFYLLGTDYVFPRTANKVLKAFLLAKGVPEANIEEEYTPFHHQDYQTIVGKLKKFSTK